MLMSVPPPPSYACYAIGHGYAWQAAATIECTISYACYAIRYCYTCQAATTVECTNIYGVKIFTIYSKKNMKEESFCGFS